jgi:hypothetical protein
VCVGAAVRVREGVSVGHAVEVEGNDDDGTGDAAPVGVAVWVAASAASNGARTTGVEAACCPDAGTAHPLTMSSRTAQATVNTSPVMLSRRRRRSISTGRAEEILRALTALRCARRLALRLRRRRRRQSAAQCRALRTRKNFSMVVMPAKAGIQRALLDSRFRGSDATLDRAFW